MNGPNHRRVVRNNLGKACGPSGNALGKQFEIGEVILEVTGDAHMVLVNMGETQLEGAEEAHTARDYSTHEVEFPKEALPSFDADVPLAT